MIQLIVKFVKIQYELIHQYVIASMDIMKINNLHVKVIFSINKVCAY